MESKDETKFHRKYINEWDEEEDKEDMNLSLIKNEAISNKQGRDQDIKMLESNLKSNLFERLDEMYGNNEEFLEWPQRISFNDCNKVYEEYQGLR